MEQTMIKTEINQDEFEGMLNDIYAKDNGIIESRIYPMLKVDHENDTEVIIVCNKAIAIRERAMFYKIEGE
jgi:hypothetical protein